jgi:NADPH-dependent 2,4-dienoyl-CoA reductase/sulfur reductase-like enzyme
MKRAQVVVVGGGPAGLAAAIEAARAGAKTLVVDENRKPGGQLFKQIHKFFGSHEHRAGVRGFRIGEELLRETTELGVEVLLDAPVYGIFRAPGGDRDSEGRASKGLMISYMQGGRERGILGDTVILATGAAENGLAFPGNTLPGVMGAGCAQTMINVNRVLPGKRIIMVGSGNVGLIVSYQLLQAGADVLALIEAAPAIGGYGVHASKIRRAGTPILVGHTVKGAYGKNSVERVEIIQVDEQFNPLPGTEQSYDADTLCIAVGEGAGVGAALAVKQHISPREVNTAELRNILLEHGAILEK